MSVQGLNPNESQSSEFRQKWSDEITTSLRAAPTVRDVAVDFSGADAPTAYVVPSKREALDGLEARAVVESWLTVFDECYELAAADDCPETSASSGWTDSFTGRPFAAEHMAEWVDTTVARVAQLAPRRVIEVGSGTGMIMKALIEQLDLREFVATDFSPQSAAILRGHAEQLRRLKANTAISVSETPAIAPVPPGQSRGYDTAIINSVAQYFPSTFYLESVIEALLPHMAQGGHIFLGDLRNSLLLQQFACLKHRMGATAPDKRSPQQVGKQLAQELRYDGELSISPDYVLNLPRRFGSIAAAEAAPRRGTTMTEMTLFRYDAVLHVGCEEMMGEPEWEDGSGITLDELKRRFASTSTAFGVQGVPNARLAAARRSQADYGLAAPTGRVPAGIDPEALCRMGERYGWRVRLRWSRIGVDGDVDAWCSPSASRDGEHFSMSVPEFGYAKDLTVSPYPLFPPCVEHIWKQDMLAHLAGKLPAGYPVPNIVFVDAMAHAPTRD
jgi:SAM-dependent methyltransferase